jgi:DNA-binding MarR family transcriptional regulator
VFSRHVKSARLSAARKHLEDRGLIVTRTEETDGRPRIVSFVTAKKANQAKKGG